MKYCPNPDCRYALRHQESQEYRDEAVTCADCGAELLSERPAWTAVATRPRDLPWIRLALAVLVPLLVVWLGPKIPLPRLDRGQLELLGPYSDQVSLSVFALGLTPILGAFWLVELAALCVPRWRPLRTGGPSGRGRLLWATHRLGLALACVQALGVAAYLDKLGALESDRRLSRLLVVFTLVAGACLLVAATEFLDGAAVGGGFSLLVTAFALPSLRPLGAILAPMTLAGGALLLVALGTIFVLRWRPAGGPGKPSAVPLPACGLVPLQWSAAIAAGALIAAEYGIWPEALRAFGTGTGAGALAVGLALTAGLGVAWGSLFNRPSKVAAFGPGAGGRVARAVARSTVYVLGLASVGWLVGRQLDLPSFSVVPLVAVAALVLDVVAEAAAIQRHGELVPVWPEHRLYAVDGALAALDRGGVPGLARSVHQRVLWHFFAPFIPVQIMVPRERAEEAGALLLDYFQAGRAPCVNKDHG